MASKIIIPRDRTIKQPVTCYCMNPECREDSADDRFEFPLEHDPVCCPKCGANESPLIGMLALVHFVVRNKEGRIRGAGGMRYSLACEPKRAYIATETNGEAGSDQLECVNCPGCLKIAFDQKLAANQGNIVNVS
jgi:hypothetical protein